jgi:hypothetical protein
VTETPSFESRRERPRPRRRGRGRWIVAVLAALVIFALGVALGAALDSNPSSGDGTTFVHTYPPLQPAPVPPTVTLTISTP